MIALRSNGSRSHLQSLGRKRCILPGMRGKRRWATVGVNLTLRIPTQLTVFLLLRTSLFSYNSRVELDG